MKTLGMILNCLALALVLSGIVVFTQTQIQNKDKISIQLHVIDTVKNTPVTSATVKLDNNLIGATNTSGRIILSGMEFCSSHSLVIVQGDYNQFAANLLVASKSEIVIPMVHK